MTKLAFYEPPFNSGDAHARQASENYSRELAALLTEGRRGDAVTLAEFLVDRGVIRYHSGAWALPPDLERGLLPDGMAGALRERLAALTPLYFGRTAGFISDTLELTTEQAERAIEAQAVEFEQLKPYLVTRWHASLD